jgi:hypothetical protein
MGAVPIVTVPIHEKDDALESAAGVNDAGIPGDSRDLNTMASFA